MAHGMASAAPEGKAKRVMLGTTSFISEQSSSHAGDDDDRAPIIEDVNNLVDNDASKALATTENAANAPLDVETALVALGFQVDRKLDDSAFGLRQPDEGDAAAPRPSESYRMSEFARAGTGYSNDSSISDRVAAILQERESLRALFNNPGSNRYFVQQQHAALGRVVRHIFGFNTSAQLEEGTASYSSSYSLLLEDRRIWRCCWRFITRTAYRLITNNVFTSFFLALTIYALFTPDMLALFGDKHDDMDFLIVDTSVFFLFALELVLFVLGQTGYVCSLPFVLDLVSLLSFLNGTWFVQDAILAKSSDRLARLARSSRVTRLARIARVARVTRLIPRLMRYVRQQNLALARRILTRRLWRVFLYLDTDADGLISNFDVKVMYFTFLQEGSQSMKPSMGELLKADTQRMLDQMPTKDDHVPYLTFDMVDRLIRSTRMGSCLVQAHLEDVEQEQSVWKLTQRLSDNTALKVCIGILVLIATMTLLDQEVQDVAELQAVAQMHVLAGQEWAAPVPSDGSFLCSQIDLFRSHHRVLFVHLNGRTVYDHGVCTGAGIPRTVAELSSRIDAVVDASGLRTSDVYEACWPDAVNCNLDLTSSVALVDRAQQGRDAARTALLTIVANVVLLLLFVGVLNMNINKFSATLLQPLRSLVDDMMVLSSPELANIDQEMAPDGARPIQPAEELEHLQTAFRAMRGAIRSWSKYVPPCVVERLYNQGVEASIGVVKVTATILFCDIDGFADICRGLSPKEVLDLVTGVLGNVADVIQRNDGTLLEFIGDEVLAVFNVPNQLKTHVPTAVISALEIHAIMSGLTSTVEKAGPAGSISCRCGVHTTQIFAGNLGSVRRMKYGLLGDGINLTARLKGLNSRYGTKTLASENVYATERARRLFVFRPVDLVAVKGKKEPTKVFEVMGLKSDEWLRQVAHKHQEAFSNYLGQHFEEARALFSEVSDTLATRTQRRDEASRLLQGRCAAYIKHPPPEGWDGVDRLTRKTFSEAPEEPEPGSPEQAQAQADLNEGFSVASARFETDPESIAPLAEEEADMEQPVSSDGSRLLSLCPCHMSGPAPAAVVPQCRAVSEMLARG